MSPNTGGAGETPLKSVKIQTKTVNGFGFDGNKFTAIPDCLRDFVVDFSHNGRMILFKSRQEVQAAGVISIPDIHYQAWITMLPPAFKHAPQSRSGGIRCIFFLVDDLPADVTMMKGDPPVYFSGYANSIEVGTWLPNQPAEMPHISYDDITAAVGSPAPKPAAPQARQSEPAASDYRAYLATDAAKMAAHGIFVVTPDTNPKDAIHTTMKMPETQGTPAKGEGGVKSFGMEAAAAVKTTGPTRLLGRRFGAGDSVIGIDCDGWKPAPDWTNGTGYYEISASGTGAHIIARIPAELIPPEGNKYKRTHGTGEVEIFYGRGNGIAITGKNATAGPIELDMNSEAGRLVKEILSGDRSGERDSRPAATPPVDELDKYEPLIRSIRTDVACWEPRDGPMTPADDASSRLMSVTNLIAGRLRKGGFPVKDDSLTVAIMKMITRRSSVWNMFYAADKGHDGHEEKVIRTIRAAIKHTTPPPPPMGAPEEDEPPEPEPDYTDEDEMIQSLYERAPAPLQAAIDYYGATSPIPQPLFAIGGALISAEGVCSRNFQTARMKFNGANQPMPPSMTNDYHTLIAPTGCGKDAIKGFLEEVIDSEYIPIISGASGSTALHLKLQQYPRVIMMIDEAGRCISESGRDPSGIKQSAETYAMMIYGNTGKISPQTFSDTKDSPMLKYFDRHGLTVIRTSTPETFAGAVTYDYVRDGWLPRQNITVSYRPRPKELGEYCPDAAGKDPTILLTAWKVWKLAHIGMPEADTYLQSVNPITAVVWGGKLPEEYQRAAKQMRNRACQYWTDIETWKDKAITIGWEDEAGAEIARIYAEIEAVPPDNYTPMRRRKLVHIIKTAMTIALLGDGITWSDMMKIHQKYAGTDEGAELLRVEAEKKKALIEADAHRNTVVRNGENRLRRMTKQESRDEINHEMQEAQAAYITAEEEYKKAHSQAEAKVRMPIRREAEERFAKIRITVEDVRWAYDYINLIETGAKKLIEDEINDIGFTPALEAAVKYLEKHGGNATETRIIEKCSAVRKLDQRLYLKAFCEYAEDTGRVVIMKTGRRGRRWYLPAEEVTGEEEKKGEQITIHKTP